MSNIRVVSAPEEPLPANQSAGEPEWYKAAVGGMWELIGKLQFDFLVANGLDKRHYLLDVGCGSLRGGLHFINYLERGHYSGIDRNLDLLRAGEHELAMHGLKGKNPLLVQMNQFEFSALGQLFEFALAQSVFTHLPLNAIIRCIANIEEVLVAGGRFYATFFENPFGKWSTEPVKHVCTGGETIVTFLDKDPFHYSFDTFEWICRRTSLDVQYIGEWGHPRGQKMMVFKKRT